MLQRTFTKTYKTWTAKDTQHTKRDCKMKCCSKCVRAQNTDYNTGAAKLSAHTTGLQNGVLLRTVRIHESTKTSKATMKTSRSDDRHMMRVTFSELYPHIKFYVKLSAVKRALAVC